MKITYSGRHEKYYIWSSEGYLRKDGKTGSGGDYWDTEKEAQDALDDYNVTENVDSKFLSGLAVQAELLRESGKSVQSLYFSFPWVNSLQGYRYWDRVYTGAVTAKSLRILKKMEKLAEVADKYPIGGKYVRTSYLPDFGTCVWDSGTEYELTNIKYSDVSKYDETVYISMGKDTTIQSDNFHKYFELVTEIPEIAESITEAIYPSVIYIGGDPNTTVEVGCEYWGKTYHDKVVLVSKIDDNFIYTGEGIQEYKWAHNDFFDFFELKITKPQKNKTQRNKKMATRLNIMYNGVGWFILDTESGYSGYNSKMYLQETEKGLVLKKWGSGSTNFESEETARKVLKKWLTRDSKSSIMKVRKWLIG